MAYFYIFPPFSLIGQVTANIKRDRVEAVVVVPQWSTQYPWVTNIGKQTPLYFRPAPTNLMLPLRPKELHPLQEKLQLMTKNVIIIHQKPFKGEG